MMIVKSGRAVLAVLVLFFVVSWSGSLFAQEPSASSILPTRLSLEQATEILLIRNPTILRERQNIAMARAGVTQARLRPNPEVEATSESYPLFESNPGPFFQNNEIIVRAGQPIEIGGKRSKRTRVAEQEVEVTQSLLQDTIRQLKLELKTRYYRVVLAATAQELARQVLGQFDEIIRINQSRYKQGEISGLDLARIETERRRFFDDVVTAELALQNSKTALLEILGASDLSAPIDVTETLAFRPLGVTAEQFQEQAIMARADLQARRQQVERERRQVAVEKSLGAPNITPFFGYKRNLVDNTVTFGVRWNLPLFNRNQGEVARAAARVDQAGYEVQRSELAVRSDVLQTYQAVQAEERRVRALEDTYVKTARKARDIAQASYRLGALDLIGFLDAERAYRETLNSYNRTLFDHRVAVFQLEAAVGKDF